MTHTDPPTTRLRAVPNDATAPEVMTVEDLAAYLQVSKRAVYNMAVAGELPAAKVASQWRFMKIEIDRWLQVLSRQNYTGPALPAQDTKNATMQGMQNGP